MGKVQTNVTPSVPVANLADSALAMWVAHCENLSPFLFGEVCLTHERTTCSMPVYDNAKFIGYTFLPHAAWSQGGPLIEKYGVSIYSKLDSMGWYAHSFSGRGTRMEGRSPLVAAMRSIVATKWGKHVDEQTRSRARTPDPQPFPSAE